MRKPPLATRLSECQRWSPVRPTCSQPSGETCWSKAVSTAWDFPSKALHIPGTQFSEASTLDKLTAGQNSSVDAMRARRPALGTATARRLPGYC